MWTLFPSWDSVHIDFPCRGLAFSLVVYVFHLLVFNIRTFEMLRAFLITFFQYSIIIFGVVVETKVI